MRTIALCATLCACITVALIVFSICTGPALLADTYDDYRHRPVQTKPPTGTPVAHSQTQREWTYSYRRDARNYGLSQEQCLVAFPLLYKEVDRAVAWRKEKGYLAEEDIEVGWRGDGIVRAMIYDNQLYVIDAHKVWDFNHRPRHLATLHSLHRAITAYQGILPNIEFTITDHDMAQTDVHGNRTTWAYSRLDGLQVNHESLWLMPDFGFWGWPIVGLRSYAELQRVIEAEEDDFLDKVPKLVWRGAVDPLDSKDVREGLVNAAKDRPWSDVQVLDWSNQTSLRERLLNMQDHCSYMFVAQTEGNTYSGRLKFLLNCHSVLVSHPLYWVEHFHHLLQPTGPGQNYIQVNRDYSDLPEKMRTLLEPSNDNIRKAETIADNARATFRERYLTPAAEACYWRALIRGWASVQGFEPQLWDVREVPDWVTGKSKLKRRVRGAPFESYAIMEEVEWELPGKPRRVCIEGEGGGG